MVGLSSIRENANFNGTGSGLGSWIHPSVALFSSTFREFPKCRNDFYTLLSNLSRFRNCKLEVEGIKG